jgi:hypothetical protein
MQIVRTPNSVYHLDGNKVMLESGTPSRHLPFGEWVEVASYTPPQVGQRLQIQYHDGKVRTTTAVVSIEGEDGGKDKDSCGS